MNQKKLEFYYKFLENYQKKFLPIGLKPEVDSHIHTTFSDGMFDMLDLIFLGKMIGLKGMVFTDHNTILPGYKYLNTIKQFIPEGMMIDIGVEIACKIIDDKTGKYIPIEMLAYHSDPYKLQEFLDKYSFSKDISQEKQLEELMYMCEKCGLVFSRDIIIPKGKFATEMLCLELIKHEENKDFFMNTHPIVWTTPKLFFKKFCANPSSEFYLDTTAGLPTYTDTIDAITDSNGISILPHPYLYIYETQKEVKMLLDKLVNTSKIGGFEAFHSSQNSEQREFIFSYAKKTNKLISGGTDFHSGPETLLGVGKEKLPLELSLDMFSWLYNN